MVPTDHLVQFAHTTLGLDQNKVFAPAIGECINATTESRIYQVGGHGKQICKQFLLVKFL